MSRRDMSGFTIIETMIFLVVSAGVFAGSISAYGSRQREVAFSQGVREFQSQLETAINDVASGYYPSLDRQCRATPSGYNFPALTAAGNEGDCIYLGKAVAASTSSAAECGITVNREGCTQYSIIPIVGQRKATVSDFNASSFAEARPSALGGIPGDPDQATEQALSNGTSVYRVFVRDSAGNPASGYGSAAVAFTTSLNNSANFDSLNGSSAVNLVAMRMATLPTNKVLVATAVRALAISTTHLINPPNGVAFCLVGGNNQRAVITIGAGGRTNDVVVQPTDQLDPGCN